MPEHDLIVIGAGPGGYVAAIRAAQLGLNVGIVEKEAELGGTCVRVGCIPSKALLESSERYAEAKHGLVAHGIELGEVGLDLAAMMKRKDAAVKANTDGVAFLMKKNKVTRYTGTGRITGPGTVVVRGGEGGDDGEQELAAEHVLIATGSSVATLPGVEIDGGIVVDSSGALAFGEVPGRFVVIGAGYIGLELGSVWQRLGSEVTVLEYLDRVLPGMDAELAKEAKKVFAKQGMRFQLGAKVTGVELKGKGAKRHAVVHVDGHEPVEADRVLVAVGRTPNTLGLGLDEVGVELDERGRVKVDEAFRTSVEGIYAIGDVITGPMLAHKAEDEGMAVACVLAGQHGHVNYDVIPGVIYTHPEVANVGETEETLKEQGRAYKIGKFSFMGNGRAKANFSADGFVKILADKETDRILGAHIIGPMAGDLIHEFCVAMEFGASAEDVALTCHAHPTYSEAVREAALACGDGPIHM